MKELSIEQMSKLSGSYWEGWGSSGCNDAMIGLGVALASAFTGPVGIITGLAGALTFVNHISDCSGSGSRNQIQYKSSSTS
ncbi:MAG: hypothetical protein RIG77_01330 [Cyclobacteriaceae bacterium]